MDGVRFRTAHGVGQNPVKVGAVEHDVGIPVALDRFRPEIEQLPRPASVPQAYLLPCRLATDGGGGVVEPERTQDPAAVRAALQARTEFGEGRRRTVKVDVDALPRSEELRAGEE